MSQPAVLICDRARRAVVFLGPLCPKQVLEVLAVLKHVGAVVAELIRPIAPLLLRFVIRAKSSSPTYSK